MDDLASKLSELLESPEGLENIKSMANLLLAGGAGEQSPGKAEENALGISPVSYRALSRWYPP